VDWKKTLGRCAASSPTIGKGVVYQSYMHPVECLQDQAGANGYVVAWDADTGRELWKHKTAPVESSPLLKNDTLYVGTWNNDVIALNAKTGRRKWRFQADDQVNTSAAYWKGRIFIASDGGTLYALSAKNGRLLWSAQSDSQFGAREFWYATPTVAYGRVYIGNTDGTMYVFGAKSGKLLWARPLGSYIYGAAAVYQRKVFVGTYDGKFYALDAATGDTRWQIDANGPVHAAPTVLDGLVYYAVCSTCGSEAQRAVASGPDATYAVRARDGKRVWRFPQGKYANPIVADEDRVYLTGRSQQYAFARRGSETAKQDARADRGQTKPDKKKKQKKQPAESS
jgi:outer membrane protein assembly factor BamB